MQRKTNLKKPAEPYWRKHVQVYQNGRLVWYAEQPSEQFWFDLWGERLRQNYFEAADRGNLQDLEKILTRTLKKDGRHVEAGCGLGYWVAALKARGYQIEGLDYSRKLIELIQTVRPDLPVRRADVLNLQSPDNEYDSYLSFGVVEHRQEGPEPFLKEALRILKPGGRVILSVPYLCPLRRLKGILGLYRKDPEQKPFFQYAFSKEELCHFMTETGFHILEVHYQHVQRCLVEESSLYFRLNRLKGGRYIKMLVNFFLTAKQAGHLILVIAEKPDLNKKGS